MNTNKTLVVIFLSLILFTLAVTSQISQVTNTISVEDVKTCTTSSYDERQNVYGNCLYYYNYTSCLNLSGPNTDCSANQNIYNFSCKTGEIITNKNTTQCGPPTKFIVSIDHGNSIDKKELDFSAWGVCVKTTENNCLAITCGTLKGGSARNGIFNGCDGGKSCQKFLFCQDSIKVLQKASRDNFVEIDPTYHLPELAIKEVRQ